MPNQTLKHSYRHFADLQLSSQDFYKKLETTIASYEFPGVRLSRSILETDGWFNHRREYLRISYGRYRFYVCAAPFGRNFFISWWFQYYRNPIAAWVFSSPIMSFLFEDKKMTFFRQDTQAMFENSIQSIVAELTNTVQPEHTRRKTAAFDLQPLHG